MSDKYERGNFETDDGRPWGFMEDGIWVLLPKIPTLLAGLGPPPFSIRLPDGRLRGVVHDTAEAPQPVASGRDTDKAC